MIVSEPRLPDWNAPLAVARHLEATPKSAVTRGLFIQDVVEAMREHGVRDTRTETDYIGFKHYPMNVYLERLHEAAQVIHANKPVRSGIRLLGQRVFRNFSSTLAGKAIFAVANLEFRKVAKLATVAYSTVYSPGHIEVESLGTGHLLVQLRDVWAFASCLQVGIWEGSMEMCRSPGEIKIVEHSLCDVDFDITWSE